MDRTGWTVCAGLDGRHHRNTQSDNQHPAFTATCPRHEEHLTVSVCRGYRTIAELVGPCDDYSLSVIISFGFLIVIFAIINNSI